MTKTVHALYDGKVLKPEGPLDLKPNVRVRITIDDLEEKKTKKRSFLDTARSLKLEGPSDWSIRLEDHLYGKGTLTQVRQMGQVYTFGTI